MIQKIKSPKGLEIEPGARYFNKTFLNVQRIGFAIMTLFIIAAILGLFGSGWISHTTKMDGDLIITYEKFIRQQATTILKINLNRCNDESILAINKKFFENISIKSINPTPVEAVSFNDHIQYSFFCDKSMSRLEVILIIEPEKYGFLHGIISTAENKIELTQFAYP